MPPQQTTHTFEAQHKLDENGQSSAPSHLSKQESQHMQQMAFQAGEVYAANKKQKKFLIPRDKTVLMRESL